MNDVFRFEWRVPRAGYTWQDTDGERLLRPAVPSSIDWASRQYAPLLDEPVLFRVFADVKATEEEVLGFANTFGNLGFDSGIQESARGQEGTAETGERLLSWVAEIGAMHKAVTAWDALVALDVETLSLIEDTWVREGSLYIRLPSPDKALSARVAAEGAQRHLDTQEGHGSAFQRDPNQTAALRPRLAESVMFKIQSAVNARLSKHVPAKMSYSKESDRLAVHVTPNNLLGALWLQFALAVDGDKRYRRCEECGAWFEAPADSGRVSKIYCSTACRVKAHRRQSRQAPRAAGDAAERNDQ